MAKIYFSSSRNLPCTEIRDLDDLILILGPLFRPGRKYYFFCERNDYTDIVSGRKYSYVIRCQSFPMKGGQVTDEVVAFSNDPIAAED